MKSANDMDAADRSRRRALKRRRTVRRRRAAAAVVALTLVAGLGATALLLRGAPTAETSATRAVDPVTTSPTRTPAAATVTAKPAMRSRATRPKKGRPSDKARLKLARVITGNISPKSVASSGTGYVTAQNMMYRHSVTVYDARRLKLVKTISDAVNLAKLGYREHRGTVRGAPVEAAFSSDGRYAYVSNYSMYGAGFGPEGDDNCTPSSGYDRSFVYRIDMRTLKIDEAYRVGAVPKVVAVTPDDRYVLVTNWCSWDLSVISTKKGKEVKRIPIGAYPRGIAVSPAGNAAYVAVMGGNNLVRVDLRRWTKSSVAVGAGPRAAEFHPSDRYIFVSLNAEGRVAKLDLKTGTVTAKVATGSAPRSLALAADGRALYVVNYESGTVSKLRTSDMKTLQTINACYHPIGITDDSATRRVWVACYTGSIRVYSDW
jgi:YVTN family beta-propeller protein